SHLGRPHARLHELAGISRSDLATVPARPRRRSPALLRAGRRQLCDAADPCRHARRPLRQSHLRHHHGRAELAARFDTVDRASRFARHSLGDLQPLHGPVAHVQGIEPMTGAAREGVWGWRAIKLVTVLVYIFMFAPIHVTIVLSFNASMFSGFPLTGLSLHW